MNWNWLWYAIPVAAGAAWWLVCVQREARQRCVWCGRENGTGHSRGCSAEIPK